MKLKDEAGRLRWDCDGCGSRLMVGDGTVVGLHGSDIRLFHAWCTAADGYFLRMQASRQLTYAQLLSELTNAALP